MGQQRDLTDQHPETDSLEPLPSPSISQLTAIAQRLRQSALQLPGLYQAAVEGIGTELKVSRCLVLTFDSQTQAFAVQAEFCQPAIPPTPTPISPGKDEAWRSLLEQHQPLILESVNFQGETLAALWMVPICHHDEVWGYLCVQQCDPATWPWSEDTAVFFQELAAQLGTAIASAVLYQNAKHDQQVAENASRLKSEFLASTTHEIRTPLNGILGFLRLILDDMADSEEEKQEFIEEAYQSALLLLNLLNDILDLAKIEAGNVDVELEAIDIFDVLQSVKSFALVQAQNKGLVFNLRLPDITPPLLVYGYHRWILQVFLNIVGNALKFTHQGDVTLALDVIPQPALWNNREKPGLLKVSVTDTGIGVAPEQQTKLFQKFVKLDAPHTGVYGGTGLGLVISRQLIEAMGGEVTFLSPGEGRGSTVVFTLLLDQPVSFNSPAVSGDAQIRKIEGINPKD